MLEEEFHIGPKQVLPGKASMAAGCIKMSRRVNDEVCVGNCTAVHVHNKHGVRHCDARNGREMDDQVIRQQTSRLF